ncbi:hypothetical protein A2686_00930 [Candidatus Woesebacteria bacterium RIFCSPHIGHO2_01_FULL_38_10]|uniref:Glycosyltransferase RgtA/B/C/D-like domain-containing protein n=1 Tax=Candidatus Woesebacteria bacterium RIFCSPLOWO2_01_FULL_39_10b TaxID=1802517 RepID=A0A1F8B9G0_9BACT|nr:MAG: hypothetical protein A2686_00930 [Candidatus Woesebacteria bacterium RIFCSPHIGHO2_01_FULL_38_10]OGM60671.1 MAG: hypothetical protein A2892_01325 [Candidatus Woesebacteria bacterium RIFCSPLOWO2_01_FULL_39_10b]
MKKIIVNFLFLAFCAFVLILSLRGIGGNPTYETLNSSDLKEEGPLELSPERGRFALTYSIIEDKSFQFSLPVAKFVIPDLGYQDGRYVSLFDPGVSLLTIPGYIIGKYFDASQVGSFAIIGLFAIANALLVRSIAKKLGANPIASSLAALIFLFGTPAFAYAVTLYQHNVTVFLMLLSVYLLLKWKGILPLFFVWFLVVGSLIVDYPNFFLFLPIGLYALGRVFPIEDIGNTIRLNIKILGLVSFVTILIPVSLFLWVHKVSYGNPLQLAGNVRSVKDFDENGNPLFREDILRRAGQEVVETPDSGDKTSIGFFKTRNMLSSLYIHLISNERGVLWFTPVILVGIFGISYLYKKRPGFTSLLLALLGSNVFLYAMWGDFWGGWAFGSRYLIPAYAVMSIFLAIALTEFKRKIFFLIIFLVLTTYSVSVNTLGALTTNRVPPKVEAVALEKVSGRKEHYTYLRNWEFLMANKSKSFIYQTFANDYVTAPQYYYIVSCSIIFVMSGQIAYMYLKARKES